MGPIGWVRASVCVCVWGGKGGGGEADWRISPTPRTSQITKKSNGQLLTS